MQWATTTEGKARFSRRRFQIGPPQDSDGLLQLFSLVLEKADSERKAGKRFGIPFASVLKLSNRNRPSSRELSAVCQQDKPVPANSIQNWPMPVRRLLIPSSRAGRKSSGISSEPVLAGARAAAPAMFRDLLEFALNSAQSFNLQGPQVCRVLAAVGQTLDARDRRFAQRNRSLADQHRTAAHQRLASLTAKTQRGQVVSAAVDAYDQIVIRQQTPWQLQFRRREEEAACMRLDGLVLWHASYIGPRSADKSENQDATFALTTPEMSSPPYLVFALADGVTTSLGSRLAASSIVRRFCELVLHETDKDRRITGGALIQAARKTQASLEELARMLLQDVNSYAFEALLGSEMTQKVATRVLENTLDPKVSAMPAALSSTLIGGVVQRNGNGGAFQVELLRIGDGTVEHIDVQGNPTSVLDTDPEVMKISEALGPGPQSRALFERPDHPLTTATVTLVKGDCLVISSDGLARGHQGLISNKLAELLGEPFWKGVRAEEADAALQVLRRACGSADQLFLQDPTQTLFADNVSLIVIRAEG